MNQHTRELISAWKLLHKYNNKDRSRMSVNTRYVNSCTSCAEDVLLVEFMYLVFTHMPGESYRRQLRSLLLYLCDNFWTLINSLVCWFCVSASGLILFQIRCDMLFVQDTPCPLSCHLAHAYANCWIFLFLFCCWGVTLQLGRNFGQKVKAVGSFVILQWVLPLAGMTSFQVIIQILFVRVFAFIGECLNLELSLW